jgi:DNA-binding winged helix-turn-helix (wHTH) protein
MPQSDPQDYEFGPFRADVRKRILERDGTPVALSGKAFEILVALLNRAGEVVDKETLMREVWPDTAVEDNNLTVNISWLRKALGEAPNDPRFIVTIPGRGIASSAICGLLKRKKQLKNRPVPPSDPTYGSSQRSS